MAVNQGFYFYLLCHRNNHTATYLKQAERKKEFDIPYKVTVYNYTLRGLAPCRYRSVSLMKCTLLHVGGDNSS